MDTLQIPISKIKVLIGFLVSCGLIFGLLILCSSILRIINDSSIMVLIGLSLIILLVSINTVLLLIYLIDSKPGLVLSHQGIINNIGVFNIGLIPWEDIWNIRIQKMSLITVIWIEVYDAKKYVSRTSNPYAKYSLCAEDSWGFSQIPPIRVSYLRGDSQQLFKLVDQYFNYFKVGRGNNELPIHH